ncbi:MAG: MBL fold metallo-hydrolase [Verrucomicrobia bacterium]|nr:MBL fold metallo-hydrolase [Verrucomicrobiota bacterium]
MPEPLIYTGGLAATNAYLVNLGDHRIAIDAPEGFLDFLKEEKIKPDSLLLTHGHWDHIWDAADLADWAGCPVYYHPDTAFLCLQPDSMLGFGLPQRLRPVPATQLLEESGPIPASWGNARLLPKAWAAGISPAATVLSFSPASGKRSSPCPEGRLSIPATAPPPPWPTKNPPTLFWKKRFSHFVLSHRATLAASSCPP